MKKAQAYTEFQQLTDCMIGKSFPSSIVDQDFFPKVSEDNKRLIKDLLDETEEDYQNLEKLLNSLNVNTYRPSYSDLRYENTKSLAPLLMNPRDTNMTLGSKIINSFSTANKNNPFNVPLRNKFNNIHEENLRDSKETPINYASIVRLGNDIIVDNSKHSNTPEHAKMIRDMYEDEGYRIHYLTAHDLKFKNAISHCDAAFAILKPGVIISHADEPRVNEFYKGWDVFTVDLPTAYFNNRETLLKFNSDKSAAKGGQGNVFFSFHNEKYWGDEFFQFLNAWTTEWMPYSLETCFDINCLVVNEENVIFSNENYELFKFLEKHNINPHVSNFRHRYFWDGGIHCITWDINREGSRENYL